MKTQAQQELTYAQKMALPHSLLLDPASQRGAAYNATHQLITDAASPELLAHALQHAHSTEKFDAQQHAQGQPARRPLPAWATADVQNRLELVRLRPAGGRTQEEWRDVPER